MVAASTQDVGCKAAIITLDAAMSERSLSQCSVRTYCEYHLAAIASLSYVLAGRRPSSF